MKQALTNYIEHCRTVFKEKEIETIIEYPGVPEHKIAWNVYHKTIAKAQDCQEFEAVVGMIENKVLGGDLERLWAKELKKREGSKAESKKEKTEWCHDVAKTATGCFFKNAGVYYNLWKNSGIDIDHLIKILQEYDSQKSENIRLFVFDGFVLFDAPSGGGKIKDISLPEGKLTTFSEEEFEQLCGLPQNIWGGHIRPDITEMASPWHILSIRQREEFRGKVGLWIGGTMISPIGLFKEPKRIDDIHIVGPIFLCVGYDSNFAEEIHIRTNPFEINPIHSVSRNGYLDWDSTDDEGNLRPRQNVKYIGNEGERLRNIYEIWGEVNKLNQNGFLRYPTEAYVRSIMNYNSFDDNYMEIFVSLMTVVESILNPEKGSELAYKTAIRGASILTNDSLKRHKLFNILSGLYKIRSEILHEGSPKKDLDLENIISSGLFPITKEIFIRYISLLFFVHKKHLSNELLTNSTDLTSSRKREKSIPMIFNSLIFNPKLTTQLEEKMAERGIAEDWMWMTFYHHLR